MFKDKLSRYLSEALVLEEIGITWEFRFALFGSVAVFLLGILVAAGVRVNEAVMAHGQFRPQSFVHKIQPAEGGIIEEIRVVEGDLVQKGMVLMRLKNAVTTSNEEQVEGRMAGLLARAARLQAFLRGTGADFSGIDPKYRDVVQDQTTLLMTQNQARQASYWVFDTQVVQKQAEVTQAEEEIRDAKSRVGINGTVYSLQERLAKKNLATRMAQLEARRALLSSDNDLRSLEIKLDKARASLNEVALKRKVFDNDLHEQASRELSVVNSEIAVTRESLASLGDRRKHLDICSPVHGRIQNMRYRSLGAVVGVGDVLMQIFPEDDSLTLELNIATKDISYVHVGQNVIVKIISFDVGRFGSVLGKVTALAPFTHMEEDKKVYFKAVVLVGSRSVGQPGQQYPILPGMLADGEIVTGSRSLLEYLLRPLLGPVKDMLSTTA